MATQGRKELLCEQAVLALCRHYSVTSTFRKRRSLVARMR